MIVKRWQAPVIPSREQIRMMFRSEGLSPSEEEFPAGSKIPPHRHPFDEVRMILSGEMMFNINGNQLLLRVGDRIEIPSNTKHEKWVNGEQPCVSVVAQRPFVTF